MLLSLMHKNRAAWPMLMLLGLFLLNVCPTHAQFPVYTYPPHSQQPIQADGMDTPMALSVDFDSSNRPYFTNDRTGTLRGKLRTLRNGLWHDIDYSSTMISWGGHRDQIHYTYVVIDGSDALYAVMLTGDGWRDGWRLLYSPDITAASPSFHSYRLAGFTLIEKNMSHGDNNVTPVIVTWPWIDAQAWPPPPAWYPLINQQMRNKLRLYIPRKNSNGTLSLSDSLDLASSHAGPHWAHSGGMPPVVSKNGLIHVVYLSGKNASGIGSQSSRVWVATIDRATKSILSHNYLSDTHGYGLDHHSMPVIGITSTDTVHVILGTHGETFRYFKATTPDSTSTLTDQHSRVPNVNEATTYVDLVIDDGDTLHTSYRAFSKPLRVSGSFYNQWC